MLRQALTLHGMHANCEYILVVLKIYVYFIYHAYNHIKQVLMVTYLARDEIRPPVFVVARNDFTGVCGHTVSTIA